MFFLHHKRTVVIMVRRADFIAIGFAFLEILDMNLMGIESELHAAARAFSIGDVAIGERDSSIGLGDEFLSDAVKNDRLMLDVKVSEVPIDTPKILSPREVVEQIKQHNPNFTQFLKDFDLGLA